MKPSRPPAPAPRPSTWPRTGRTAPWSSIQPRPPRLAVDVGWPLPRRLRAWPGIRVFLTSPLTNDAIIKALAGLTWLLWLAFTVSVIIEAVAVARGGHAPRLPVIAPVQGFAAAL